ncbi:MAG: hypothetical protein AVDCRST_MAG22-913, partial [uncultured Rubrobacteraceae bacterium]
WESCCSSSSPLRLLSESGCSATACLYSGPILSRRCRMSQTRYQRRTIKRRRLRCRP